MPRHYIPSLLDTKAVEPMSEKLTDMFLKCTIMEKQLKEQGKTDYFNAEIAEQTGFAGQVFWKRLEYYANVAEKPVPQITVGAAIIALMQCTNPGSCVMWAFTFNRMFLENGGKPVDMTAIAYAFPIGFPTETGLSEIWDAQKGKNWGEPVDNMLDNATLLSDTQSDSDKQEWCKWLKT